MAKKVIFIRHPHKVGDDEGIYPGDTAEIAPQGYKEMQLVIPRLRLLNPTVILSSIMPRAKTLAQFVSRELGFPEPYYWPYLNEIEKPQFLAGLRRDDPEAQRVMRAIRDQWDADTVPTELLRGVRIRRRTEVEQDIRMLLKQIRLLQPSQVFPVTDVVLCVSHAKTIAAIGQMVFEDTLLGYYQKADRAFKVSTTGITILTFEPNRRTGQGDWAIETWNEKVHIEQGVEDELISILNARLLA